MLVLPILAGALPSSLADSMTKYLPTEAGTAVMHTVRMPHTLSPWTGLGLLAAYCAVALVAAGLLLRHRDA